MKKHVKKILLSAALVLSLGSACFLNVFAGGGGGAVIPLSNGDHLVFDTVSAGTYIVHESSESIQITPYLYNYLFCVDNQYLLNGAHIDEKTHSLIIPKK